MGLLRVLLPCALLASSSALVPDRRLLGAGLRTVIGATGDSGWGDRPASRRTVAAQIAAAAAALSLAPNSARAALGDNALVDGLTGAVLEKIRVLDQVRRVLARQEQ